MTDGLRSIRPLKAESLRGVTPAEIGRARPKFEWVDPTTLFVEESYQREIAEGGTALIRKGIIPSELYALGLNNPLLGV